MCGQKSRARRLPARSPGYKRPAAWSKRVSCQLFHSRDRNYETAAPSTCVIQLLKYFIAQVPGQNQNIVRSGFTKTRGRKNRDTSSRQEKPLLVRILIDSVVEEILP